MRVKSILAALFLMVAGLQIVWGQDIRTLMMIHKSNGTMSSVYVDDIDSISFVQIHQDDNRLEMQLLPFMEDFHEIQPAQSSRRRISIPSGYTAYNPQEAPEIGFFITEDRIIEEGSFIKSKDVWSTHVNISNDRNYQIYGYMPKDGIISANITPNLSYANGCNMTLSGLKTITSTDVCFVTGVKQAYGSFSAEENLQQGTFGFTGRGVDEGNYIYMLFNHLYTSINFQIYINADYDALRTIKVKSMSLRSDQYSTSTATVTLTANDSGSDPVSSIEWVYDNGSCEETIFDSNTIDPTNPFILSTSQKSIGTCLIPPRINSLDDCLILRTNLDVYDKSGNLIRENCITENVIRINQIFQEVLRGHNYIIKLEVCPTYLYILSEPDLNTPVVYLR